MPRPARPEVSVLSAVLNALPEPFAIADRSGRIVFQNVHWNRIDARNALYTGTTNDDETFMRRFGVIGCSLPDPASAATDLRGTLTGVRRSFSLRHKINDGCGERWLQMEVTGIRGLPGHVAIIHRNVNDLRQAQCDIARLSMELLEAKEIERRRIARMIHDTTAQQLVAAKLYLEKALSDAPQIGGFFECGMKALEHLEHALREIRTLSYLLHQPDLDEADFIRSIRLFLNGFVERTGIQVAFDVASGLPQMSPTTKRTLFLIIQEALTNVYRHSESNLAVVSIRSKNGELILEIIDYGRGFPTCVIDGKRSTRPGVGIVSMRARVEPYHGTLTIRSCKHGTTLRVALPSASLMRAEESTPACDGVRRS
jgi:signal transduction histidine kinase